MANKRIRTKKPKETEVFSLRMPLTLYAKIKVKAEAESRTMNNWIRLVLEQRCENS